MYASVRVEGKFLEFFGGEGGQYPFRVMESSSRRRSFIKLRSQEYSWLADELARFCYSKGEPIWVKTFRGANRCLLLQLRQNARGRFIVFSLIGSIGRSGTIIFPEGSKADGWFALTKLLRESLFVGKGEAPYKQWKRPVFRRSRAGNSISYAEAMRGRVSDPQNSYLKGWRCRQCGS